MKHGPLCTVDGCNGQHAARGMCAVHYLRWYRRKDQDAYRAINRERVRLWRQANPERERENQRRQRAKLKPPSSAAL